MSNQPESTPAADTLQAGPFKMTTTQSFKITGPIEVTITEVVDATHVPPKPGCGCGGGHVADPGPSNADIMTALNTAAAAVVQYMQSKDAE